MCDDSTTLSPRLLYPLPLLTLLQPRGGNFLFSRRTGKEKADEKEGEDIAAPGRGGRHDNMIASSSSSSISAAPPSFVSSSMSFVLQPLTSFRQISIWVSACQMYPKDGPESIPPRDRLLAIKHIMERSCPDLKISLDHLSDLDDKFERNGFPSIQSSHPSKDPFFFTCGGSRGIDVIYEHYTNPFINLPLITQRTICVFCKKGNLVRMDQKAKVVNETKDTLNLSAADGPTIWTQQYGPLVKKGVFYHKQCEDPAWI